MFKRNLNRKFFLQMKPTMLVIISQLTNVDWNLNLVDLMISIQLEAIMWVLFNKNNYVNYTIE